MDADLLNLECLEEDLCTPKKTECTVKTPRQSERKRALFPSASPQSSDLGPISPLCSSPESSPIPHYDASPNPVRRMSKSPFKSAFVAKLPPTPIRRESPRKKFAQLGTITLSETAAQTVLSSTKKDVNEITPQRTPVATPSESLISKSEMKPSQPVTPSKKRSKSLGAVDLAESPGHKNNRFSLDSRSRSSDSPKARTSLFSDSSRSKTSKRHHNDDVYLTGRTNKRQRVYGEINKGVRTGIKRPVKKKTPPSKPPRKPHASKVKSVWEVGPSSKKKKEDPLLKFSIFPMFSKKKSPEVQQPSQSASGHLIQASRGEKRRTEETELEAERQPSPEPDPNKRFFKTNRTLEINRKATVTVSKGVKLVVTNGTFQLDNAKKRRKLFNHAQDPAFDDDVDDPVIDKSRERVSSILKKLETEDEGELPKAPLTVQKPTSLPPRPPLLPTPKDYSPPRRFPEIAPSPLLSPLSALASSTSTLSLNLHKEKTPSTAAPTVTQSTIPSVLMEEDEGSCSQSEDTKENNSADSKLFPIFNKATQLSDVTNTPERTQKKASWRPIGDDQYQIDAGQKRFGATECGECGLVYQLGDPEDEIRHNHFHFKTLSHSGWKNERIIWRTENSYISLVLPNDPKIRWDRVEEVLKIVDHDLGFAEIGIRNPDSSQVFLYVSKRQIVGCLLAEPVSAAYRMLISEEEAGGVDCCSEEEYPVLCGISRLWVHRLFRRRNIASQLVECMRRHFALGKFLSVDELAFSSPTVDGKKFAAKYTNRSDYLVYM